jgi:hypothetical protein
MPRNVPHSSACALENTDATKRQRMPLYVSACLYTSAHASVRIMPRNVPHSSACALENTDALYTSAHAPKRQRMPL